MQSYFERRRFQRFKTVLEEMRATKTRSAACANFARRSQREIGLSIAQCEFWSDTFDRWADDLIDPAACGKCPGCKSKSSLPPSVVLEAMQILEAEVNLREETRVAQQARSGLADPEFAGRCGELHKAQGAISERVGKLTTRIRELPDGEAEFGKEIALLERVEQVMDEAAEILGRPEAGPPAIAAETEAIELLLQSKRINPRRRGRRRLVARRRRRWNDYRRGPGADRLGLERQRGPRGPWRRSGYRRIWRRTARGISSRLGRILQPVGTHGRPAVSKRSVAIPTARIGRSRDCGRMSK